MIQILDELDLEIEDGWMMSIILKEGGWDDKTIR